MYRLIFFVFASFLASNALPPSSEDRKNDFLLRKEQKGISKSGNCHLWKASVYILGDWPIATKGKGIIDTKWHSIDKENFLKITINIGPKLLSEHCLVEVLVKNKGIIKRAKALEKELKKRIFDKAFEYACLNSV